MIGISYFVSCLLTIFDLGVDILMLICKQSLHMRTLLSELQHFSPLYNIFPLIFDLVFIYTKREGIFKASVVKFLNF